MRARFGRGREVNPATAIMFALAAAAMLSCCVCCVGGLADALSPPYAIGVAVAAAVLGLAAASVGIVRVWRPFRSARRAAAAYLDAMQAGDLESAQRWLTHHGRTLGGVANPMSPGLTAYRINGIQLHSGDLGTRADVAARLSFTDGSSRAVVLLLVRETDEWRIEGARVIEGERRTELGSDGETTQ